MENNFDPKKIKLKYKYYLIRFSKEKKKTKLLIAAKKLDQLKKEVVGLELKENEEIILIRLSKEKKFTGKTGMLGNLIGGPIKLTFKIFELTSNSILKIKYEKQLNKNGQLDEDKRNSQYLYLTIDYLKSGVKTKDMEKVALLVGENKLEKRPMAPKLIDQIYKIK